MYTRLYDTFSQPKEDQAVTLKRSELLAEIKDIILSTQEDVAKAPVKAAIVYTVEKKLNGDEKSAEKQAIDDYWHEEPFYESICAALLEDPQIVAALPKDDPRLSAEEDILPQKDGTFNSQMRIWLHWGPRPKLKMCKVM